MKTTHFKDKVSEQGRSEFVRAKLQAEYNPKLRSFKPQPLSHQEIPPKDRHEFIAREENQICSQAIRQIRGGSCLVLDWNTRTNFRTTNTHLPRLATEPVPPPERLQSRRHSCIDTSIENKRMQLARLLHHRHKKRYMQTKQQQQQQKLLFGFGLAGSRKTSAQHLWDSSPYEGQLSRSRSKDQNIEQIQQSILNHSKLKILKEDLKVKFDEIKATYKTTKKKARLYSFFNKQEIS